MCIGSEAGSHLRLIDFVYHPTLGLRVIKKKRRTSKRSGNSVPGINQLTYMGTSFIRNSGPLGPYGRTMPRAL